MPACPSTSSPKNGATAPAPGAWPAIVARIADPAADAHRVFYLLEPWPECARIVHRIGGNGTADQAQRGRQCGAPNALADRDSSDARHAVGTSADDPAENSIRRTMHPP